MRAACHDKTQGEAFQWTLGLTDEWWMGWQVKVDSEMFM